MGRYTLQVQLQSEMIQLAGNKRPRIKDRMAIRIAKLLNSLFPDERTVRLMIPPAIPPTAPHRMKIENAAPVSSHLRIPPVVDL